MVPDEHGNQKTETVPDTPLHAYGDGRTEDAEPGSRGITGDQGTGDAGAYHEGGHADDTEFGDTPRPASNENAPGANAGIGSGKTDPDRAS